MIKMKEWRTVNILLIFLVTVIGQDASETQVRRYPDRSEQYVRTYSDNSGQSQVTSDNDPVTRAGNNGVP